MGAVAEEVATRNKRSAAWRAGGDGDKGVGGKDALLGDPVEGRSGDNVVGSGQFRISVGGSVTPEVVGKEKKNVGLGRCFVSGTGRENWTEGEKGG